MVLMVIFQLGQLCTSDPIDQNQIKALPENKPLADLNSCFNYTLPDNRNSSTVSRNAEVS